MTAVNKGCILILMKIITFCDKCSKKAQGDKLLACLLRY